MPRPNRKQPRQLHTNPRALHTNPRALGTNPRELAKHPKQPPPGGPRHCGHCGNDWAQCVCTPEDFQ